VLPTYTIFIGSVTLVWSITHFVAAKYFHDLQSQHFSLVKS